MNKIALLITRFALLVLIVSSPVFAADTSVKNSIVLGYITYGSTQTATVAIRPDFKVGAWNLGIDINMPLSQTNAPSNYDTLVLRYAEYNDGEKGLRYGSLDNVTLGKGLLMRGYSTRTYGSIVLTNQQVALSGFLNAERVKFQFLNTWSHIYAFRLSENVHPMLTLGQSYITDADGVLVVQQDSSTKQFPSVSGMAFDATVPLPLNLEGYAEVARMISHGNAFTYGVNWGFDAMVFALSCNAGYRTMDRQFVPGYFNANYETNPIDFVSYEASGINKNGYVAEIRALAGEILKLGFTYENYNNNNAAVNGEAVIGLHNIELRGFYNQPDFVDFRSLDLQQGAILRGSIGYKINPSMILVFNYKKFYDGSIGEIVESNYWEAKFTL